RGGGLRILAARACSARAAGAPTNLTPPSPGHKLASASATAGPAGARPARGGKEQSAMPKDLVHGACTLDGVKGLMKEGGTARRMASEQAIQSVGGKLEAFYFAFGADDFYVIIDMPDVASIAAASLAVNAGGGTKATTVVLISPEEMDAAAKK